jgi:tRNA A-37 threonylcarbamoyl transferase component Bud32
LQAASGWVLDGRYRVLDRLGGGGMAEVFRAHDELLDRDVAVKVFRTVRDPDADGHAELRRELELHSLARLSHPNLITLFDGSLTGDGPGYLVLELVDGPDLATRLHDGPLPEPLARQVCAQVADALAYVHAQGMVHRDVKPANILLSTDPGQPGTVRARLSDFGIVRMVGSTRLTAADLTLGTASYVAPEQARGANVDTPADVYSLGLVMIEALTGVRCFDGPLFDALAARLQASPEVPATLPEPWPALLRAMTDLEPARRPTAAQVAAAFSPAAAPLLTDMLAPAPAVVPAEAAPPVRVDPDDSDWYPVPERPRRGVGILLAVVAFVAILAGGGYFLFAGHAKTPAGGPSDTPVRQVSTPAAKHHSATAGPSGATHVAPPPVHHPRAHRTHAAVVRHSAAQVAPSPTATTPAAPTSSAPPSSPAPTPTPSSTPALTTSPPPTP